MDMNCIAAPDAADHPCFSSNDGAAEARDGLSPIVRARFFENAADAFNSRKISSGKLLGYATRDEVRAEAEFLAAVADSMRDGPLRRQPSIVARFVERHVAGFDGRHVRDGFDVDLEDDGAGRTLGLDICTRWASIDPKLVEHVEGELYLIEGGNRPASIARFSAGCMHPVDALRPRRPVFRGRRETVGRVVAVKGGAAP